MAQIERDLLKDVVHFEPAMRIEGLASGKVGYLIKRRRSSGYQWSKLRFLNSNRVDHHVGLFEGVAQVAEGVAGTIVLSIANHDHCALRISAARNAFRRQVDAVIESSIALRLHENEPVENGLTVTSVIDEEICAAALQINEEVLVLRMTASDEVFERAHGEPDLCTAHRAGSIKDDSDADRSVFVAEVRDFLLPFVIKDCEVFLAEAGDETAVFIGDCHLKIDDIGIGDERVLLINLAGLPLGIRGW